MPGSQVDDTFVAATAPCGSTFSAGVGEQRVQPGSDHVPEYIKSVALVITEPGPAAILQLNHVPMAVAAYDEVVPGPLDRPSTVGAAGRSPPATSRWSNPSSRHTFYY